MLNGCCCFVFWGLQICHFWVSVYYPLIFGKFKNYLLTKNSMFNCLHFIQSLEKISYILSFVLRHFFLKSWLAISISFFISLEKAVNRPSISWNFLLIEALSSFGSLATLRQKAMLLLVKLCNQNLLRIL